MIVIKRTFQQILGGAPFIISGACGMFRADILREVGLSDRTMVEDLDLTWSLVSRGIQGPAGQPLDRLPTGMPDASGGMASLAALDHGLCGVHAPALAPAVHPLRVFQHLPMFLVVVLGLASYALVAGAGRICSRPQSAFCQLLMFPLAWLRRGHGLGFHQRLAS